MQFRIFPIPTIDMCTPFIFTPHNSFSRYYYDNENNLKKLKIRLDVSSSRINIKGCNEHEILGLRKPIRENIIDYINRCDAIDQNFKKFILKTNVIPTYPLSKEEALIKTIIRQIISSQQAKKLFSDFIKKFGVNKNGIFGFPTKQKLIKISVEELKKIGLGLKAERINKGIHLLNNKNFNEINGIGPWSIEVLDAEINKDYMYYPFWDKSGEKILKICGIDLVRIKRRDIELAGDLYIYGASFLETLQ